MQTFAFKDSPPKSNAAKVSQSAPAATAPAAVVPKKRPLSPARSGLTAPSASFDSRQNASSKGKDKVPKHAVAQQPAPTPKFAATAADDSGYAESASKMQRDEGEDEEAERVMNEMQEAERSTNMQVDHVRPAQG